MTSKNSMLHIRIDNDLKDQSQETLKSLGISMPDAIRIFLSKVVDEQAIPFEVRVPNTKTITAMNEADQIIEAKKALFDAGND